MCKYRNGGPDTFKKTKDKIPEVSTTVSSLVVYRRMIYLDYLFLTVHGYGIILVHMVSHPLFRVLISPLTM